MKMFHILALMAIEAVLLCAGVSLASRNSSGTMGSVNGPYVSGTTINSATLNARFSDLESELTDSLSRSGKGGMTAPVRTADGTSTAPSYAFTSETTAGLYRAGSADLRLTFNGTLGQRWTSSNLYLPLPLTSAAGSYPLQITGPASDQTIALFGATSRTPIGIYAHSTVPNISSNATNDGTTGWKYATSNAAQALDLEMGSGGFNFFIAPSGTAGNAITFTKYMNLSTSGLTIGTTGTAIGASYYGTTSWTPPSVVAGGTTSVAITLTGAAAGAACIPIGVGSAGNSQLLPFQCWVTLNTCTLSFGNPGAGAVTPQSGTYGCRVFNN